MDYKLLTAKDHGGPCVELTLPPFSILFLVFIESFVVHFQFYLALQLLGGTAFCSPFEYCSLGATLLSFFYAVSHLLSSKATLACQCP